MPIMTGGSQPLPVVMVASIEGEEFPMIRHFFPFFTKLLVLHFLAFTSPWRESNSMYFLEYPEDPH